MEGAVAHWPVGLQYSEQQFCDVVAEQEVPFWLHVVPASGTQKPFTVSHARLQQPVFDAQPVKSAAQVLVAAQNPLAQLCEQQVAPVVHAMPVPLHVVPASATHVPVEPQLSEQQALLLAQDAPC